MSDGPMDRSDPSDKQSYGRTIIIRMVKRRNCKALGSTVLKQEGLQAWQMSDGPMDRSDPSDKHSYGRTNI